MEDLQQTTSTTTNNYTMQTPLPNATPVLVLGIISIIGSCCYGIVGLICGIIALVLAKKSTTQYNANPSAYTVSSLKNVNAGRICAIIGLILSALYLIVVIGFVGYFGMEALKDPQAMQEMLENMKNS
jgi:hypothetical protein